MDKYGAVIQLSDGESALVTSESSIIVGSRKDMHTLFGSLILQLVPISERTSVKQINVREHSPDFFKKELDT